MGIFKRLLYRAFGWVPYKVSYAGYTYIYQVTRIDYFVYYNYSSKRTLIISKKGKVLYETKGESP